MRDAWREISRQPRRYAAVLAAVVISTGFLVGSLVFVATSTHALGVRTSERTAHADLVVTPGVAPDWSTTIRILRSLPGVGHAEPVLSTYAAFGGSTAVGYLVLDSLPQDPRLRWGRLAEGEWPDAGDELAVTAGTAQDYGLAVGQPVPITDGLTDVTTSLRLTGIIAEPRSVFANVSAAGVVDLAFLAGGDVLALHLVTLETGRDPADVAATIRAALPPDAVVQTSDEYAAAALRDLADGTDLHQVMLLVAGSVALVTGSLIITNTFTLLVASRRRQIGLLRAVGASGRDVRRGLWAEALLLGLTGAVAGLGFGLLAGAAAAAVSGDLESGLVVPPGQVAGAAAAGFAVTLAAAVLPAQRATRIPPLAALSPVADAATVTRVGRLRTLGSGSLVVVGALLVVIAFTRPRSEPPAGFWSPLLLATAGSALLAFGILAAAPLFLAPVLRGTHRLVRRTPPVVRIAVANAARNPRRTAAGTVALMLAVGLIVTLQVGTASARVTVLDGIEREFPVDLAVSNPAGTLDPGLFEQVRAVPGIEAVSPVVGTVAVVQGRAPDDGEWPVYGLAGDAAAVVAGFDRVRDDVVLAHPNTLKSARMTAGQQITLVVDARAVTVRVEASDVAAFGGFVTTTRTVERLAPDPPVRQLWAAAADGVESRTVMAGVAKVLAARPGLQLEGSLEQSAAVAEVLDSLVLIATALLGVAALIAVIGVGNTLWLSVLERSRESALLRALGLQRRQLYAVLAGEAVLLALVGAVVGVAAGVLFGAIGAAAMLSEFGPLRLSVPIADVATVVGVAVVAGVLASVLPGRRAARETPVAALTAE